jgi:hypothetical protein
MKIETYFDMKGRVCLEHDPFEYSVLTTLQKPIRYSTQKIIYRLSEVETADKLMLICNNDVFEFYINEEMLPELISEKFLDLACFHDGEFQFLNYWEKKALKKIGPVPYSVRTEMLADFIESVKHDFITSMLITKKMFFIKYRNTFINNMYYQELGEIYKANGGGVSSIIFTYDDEIIGGYRSNFIHVYTSPKKINNTLINDLDF